MIESELRRIVIKHTDSENKLDGKVNQILDKEKDIYDVMDEFLSVIQN